MTRVAHSESIQIALKRAKRDGLRDKSGRSNEMIFDDSGRSFESFSRIQIWFGFSVCNPSQKI